MVQRASAPTEFGGLQTQGFQQVQAGLVAPDVRAERTFEVDSGRDRIIGGILSELESTAKQGFKRSLEDAYLEGVAKVGQVQSEDELEGDMFTRDWKVAGHRDTLAKFAIADAEAQLAVDMKELRKQSPEEFQKYLAEQRNKLTPSLEGMSREQRNAAFGQMAMSTRSAIKTHTAEHTKFIIETEERAVSKVLGTGILNLNRALSTGSGESYRAELDNMFSSIHSNIWQNSKFDRALKEKTTVQMMENALNSNNVALFEMMQRRVVSIDGENNTMFTALSMDNQEKLAGKYRTAFERTAAERNTLYLDMTANIESAYKAGEIPMEYDDLKAHLDTGMNLGVVSGSKRESMMQAYFDAKRKNVEQFGFADAYQRGDLQTIRNGGGDESRASAAASKAWAKLPVPEQFLRHSKAGEMGMMTGYKTAGDLANPSIAQLARPDGTMNPQHATMFELLNKQLDSHQKNDPIAYNHTLAGLTPENRKRIERLRGLAENGVTGDPAIAKVLKLEEADNNPNSARAVVAKANQTEDIKFIQSLEAEGPVSRAALAIKSIWNPQAALQRQLSPTTGLVFKDRPEKVDAEYLSMSRDAVAEEFQHIDLAGSEMSRDARYRTAMAGVTARTVKSELAGPVILPRGYTSAQFFGVQASNETVGIAVDNVLKKYKESSNSEKENTFVVRPRNGVLMVQEYNAQGDPMSNPKPISSATVADEVKRMFKDQEAKINTLYGEGKTVKRDKVTVQYNGNNSAGVENEWALEFRDNLVKHEGVRDTVYSDISNKSIKRDKPVMTVGVGVSSTNTHFPAKGLKEGDVIPQAAIQESFRAASNDAARIGAGIQRQLNGGKEIFLLASELAYQSGAVDKTSSFKKLWSDVQLGDKTAALTSLRETPAYKLAHKERQAHYEKLLNQALKG